MGLLDDMPVAAIERAEVWEIARRLGFKVPGDQVVTVNLGVGEIAVVTADLNEAGQKFIVVNPQTHMSVSCRSQGGDAEQTTP